MLFKMRHFYFYFLFFILQIWELVDSKTGYLTRNGLYKGLALVAFAQQGKQPSDKLFENCESQGEDFCSY